jgi:hypothetical protein
MRRRVPHKPKKVVGVYECELGNWCGRYRSLEGKLVRKSFGLERTAAVYWVEEARVMRRIGTLPSSAKARKKPSGPERRGGDRGDPL